MLFSILKGALGFYNQYVNEKKVCIKPECNSKRHKNYEYCQKHQEARDLIGEIIFIAFVLVVIWLIWF